MGHAPQTPKSSCACFFDGGGGASRSFQSLQALSTAGRGYGTCSGDVLVLAFYANGAQDGIEEPADRPLTSVHLYYSTPSYRSLRLPYSIPLHPV